MPCSVLYLFKINSVLFYWYCCRLLAQLLFVWVIDTKTCIAGTWWDGLKEGPTCSEPETCGEGDATCECFLTIEHRLTMMTSPDPVLVWPKNGSLYRFDDVDGNNPLPKNTIKNTITSDGVGSRMVITVNGLFPGPSIVAYEGQDMIIHVRNLMHTESTSIHWHGIKQTNSVYSDGVAFITQCPILPGQNFTYRFKANPLGTHFYHAQMGNQRSMGLYGALIIKPKENILPLLYEEFTVLLQDWNHNDDPETSYLRMMDGVYDLDTRKFINASHSVDGTKFGEFEFHSGLINGMGRFYKTNTVNNEAPLQSFEVEQSKNYLFRVISAATLYPFRVYIEGHRELTILASDGYDIVKNNMTTNNELVVESFIIHPGERFDFLVNAAQSPGSYLIVAESLEDLDPSVDEYHAAEAILHYVGTPVISNPPKSTPNSCTLPMPCTTFNCPFLYYPLGTNRTCLTFDNETYSEETEKSNFREVLNVKETLYYNFGLPGDLTKNRGSVNGRQFVFPAEPMLYRIDKMQASCENAHCGPDNVCRCTFYDFLEKDMAYQIVLSNIGDGKGWSHPIHLHGYHFYVVKMGFGRYDRASAKIMKETNDIRCTGLSTPNLCNKELWKPEAWISNPNSIPGIKLSNPPRKDTIIVPSGGFVIIRFKASNPGPWFFHSQVNLHTTYGLGMVLYVGNISDSPKLTNSLVCWNDNLKESGGNSKISQEKENPNKSELEQKIGIGLGSACCGAVITVIIYFFVSYIRRKTSQNQREVNIPPRINLGTVEGKGGLGEKEQETNRKPPKGMK